MSEFEDRQLAARLGRVGGEQPDDNRAYAAVLGKVRRARRRRAAALAGGTMFGLALLATVVAINTSQSDRSLRPAAPNTSGAVDTVDGTRPVSTDVPGTNTTTASSIDGSAVITDGSVASDSTAGGGSTSPSTAPDQTPVSNPPPSPPSTTPSTPSPPPTSAATTSTFSGIGGSITVRLQNGTLTLVGSSPAGGFTAQVTHGGGQRVEVLFTSDDHETRIRVDVSDGAMDPDIDENGNSGDEGDGDAGPDETDD